ncbi:MAG: DUF3990 domain-containing protein [Prevotella sp.]|nr:DUF3990 domain-containing protein [Prevotella sp.]
MEVFHTSNGRVEYPDIYHSRKELDFGPGFYLTTLREQAERYSVRFFKRQEKAWLNIYELAFELKDWKVKIFNSYDEEWLDFVVACRTGNIIGDYDMVIGGIANDRVFDTLNLFFDKFIQKDEALRRLVFEKPNIQYCIRTESMIKKCLKFKDCIQL